MKRIYAAMVAIVACTGSVLMAGDWAQFLGPTRNAVSTETGLLKSWPKDGPREVWSAPMGGGYGAAAIEGGEVIVLDRSDDEGKDILRVFDLQTGQEKWRYDYEAPGRAAHPGSRSTPTIEGEMVFTIGSFGHVHAFNRKTQKVVWSFNLDSQYGQAQLRWAYAQSPLVYRDTLILTPLAENAPALIALDKATGKVKWESQQRFGGDYYASPMIEKVGGVEGIMILMANTKENNLLLFADPTTGKTIWTYNGYGCMWTIPAPTVLPDGKHIFITGGYDAGSVMIAVDRAGKGFKVSERWKIEEGSQIHPAIFHKGLLYANINTNTTLKKGNEQTGGLACIDPASGKVLWRTGAEPNFERGAFIWADGRVILIEGKLGDLVMGEVSPKGYREISRTPMFTPERGNTQIWAPIALADGYLVIRDHTVIKCLDLKGRQTAQAN